jgi:radical SAM protein with 4Fe4S-binding SPASM domain
MGAVMFIDVTDVVHLNPSATEITWMALEGVPRQTALTRLGSRYHPADRDQLTKDIHDIYEMVNSLNRRGDFCPTCSIPGVSRTPLFSTALEAPYKVDLALTYGCNNQCAHCYNEPSRYPMASLPESRWVEVIDKLHEIGVPHIIFTGGEATLHPDLPLLIEYADSLGMITGLNTNGRRLSYTAYSEQLAEAGLNHVQITLASHEAQFHNLVMGANAFDQTVQGIRNAIDSDLHVITNTTLTSQNIHDLPALLDFIHSLGIRTFAMNGIIHSGGGQAHRDAINPEKLAPLISRIREESQARDMRFLWYTPTDYCQFSPVESGVGAKRCNAGEYSICIEPNGDVLPCQSYYVPAGNILTNPWQDIWQGELFLSFRNRVTQPERSNLPTKCWDCSELSICGGGCRLEHQALDAHTAGGTNGKTQVSLTSIQVLTSGDASLDGCYIPPAGAASARTRGSGTGDIAGSKGSSCI